MSGVIGLHLVRFALVGAGVAALYALLYLMLLRAGIAQPLANGAAFLIAVAAQYAGQAAFTFGRPLAVAGQAGRFAAMIMLGLAVSAAITAVAPAFGWPDWAAALVVILWLPVQNYLVMKIWVFAGPHPRQERI